jgi:kynurenine 3-monooxygenase
MPNVSLHFNHKLTGADFNRKVAWFEVKPSATAANAGKTDPYGSGGDPSTDSSSSVEAKEAKKNDRPHEVEVKFDFMIGADGAHSAARFHLMKYARMNYQQEYIDTLWCEFTIPPADTTSSESLSPSAKDGFRLNPNRLHIWPAGMQCANTYEKNNR